LKIPSKGAAYIVIRAEGIYQPVRNPRGPGFVNVPVGQDPEPVTGSKVIVNGCIIAHGYYTAISQGQIID
jgi:hypothetical protein